MLTNSDYDQDVVIPYSLDGIEITSVYVQHTTNLGNYESAKVGLTATVKPGQCWSDIVDHLRKAITEQTKRSAIYVRQHPDRRSRY